MDAYYAPCVPRPVSNFSPTASYSRGVIDFVIVGGGTAGSVLAARLSEDPGRQVRLLEAGPDYGPLDAGRWPADILDAGALAETHGWGTGGEDERTLGARILGGSSACNACMVVQGSPADYDEWGPDWPHKRFAPFLGRARAELRTASANTDRPAPIHLAFIEAAQAAGFPLLADPDDPAQPAGKQARRLVGPGDGARAERRPCCDCGRVSLRCGRRTRMHRVGGCRRTVQRLVPQWTAVPILPPREVGRDVRAVEFKRPLRK